MSTLTSAMIDSMKVQDLRDALISRGLDTKGNKFAMVKRLKDAVLKETVAATAVDNTTSGTWGPPPGAKIEQEDVTMKDETEQKPKKEREYKIPEYDLNGPPKECGTAPKIKLNGMLGVHKFDKTAVVYEVIEEKTEDPEKKYFKLKATVKGDTFIGEGKSRFVAQNAICEKALLKLFNIMYKQGPKREKVKKAEPKKHPRMKLNEMLGSGNAVHFELLDETGPPHLKEFNVKAIINGEEFLGAGRSKTLAKTDLCAKALLKLFNFHSDLSTWAPVGMYAPQQLQAMGMMENGQPKVAKKKKNKPKKKPNGEIKIPAYDLTGPPKECGTHPKLKLNQMLGVQKFDKTAVQYEVVEETGEGQDKKFTLKATIKDQVFTGTGSSKFLAQTDLGAKALLKLFNILYKPVPKPPVDPMAKLETTGLTMDVNAPLPEGVSPCGKHPRMQLNELLGPENAVHFDLLDETMNEYNQKQFNVKATINGEDFFGIGRSQKLAKTDLCAKALLKLYKIQYNPALSTDSRIPIKRKYEAGPTELLQTVPMNGAPQVKSQKMSGPPVPKNALQHLNEVKPGLKFEIIPEQTMDNKPPMSFTARVEVNGQVYDGQGRSKKHAKQSAAEAALRTLVPNPSPAPAVKPTPPPIQKPSWMPGGNKQKPKGRGRGGGNPSYQPLQQNFTPAAPGGQKLQPHQQVVNQMYTQQQQQQQQQYPVQQQAQQQQWSNNTYTNQWNRAPAATYQQSYATDQYGQYYPQQ